jgi:NAD(P)-dependent dehydrogenase (short-subunit alcohol dehydrogenase family)
MEERPHGAVRVFLSGLVDSSAFHEVSLVREVSIDFTSNGPLIHRWEANKYLTRVESHTRSWAAGSPECRSNAWGRPEEIAETIVFVASNKTSYIMGASIAAGGGKWAR